MRKTGPSHNMTIYGFITLMAQINLNNAANPKLKPKAMPILPASERYLQSYLTLTLRMSAAIYSSTATMYSEALYSILYPRTSCNGRDKPYSDQQFLYKKKIFSNSV